MLGCRQDTASLGVGRNSESQAAAEDFGRQLCEEYRLEHGPRQPGDPCAMDFDCLPYEGDVPKLGTAWSSALSCNAGVCGEMVVTRDDSGQSCAPAVSGGFRSYLTEGACESGICLITEGTTPGANPCTMPCNRSEDCPSSMECAPVSLASQTLGTANVCVFLLDGGEGGTGGGGAGGASGGSG